MAKEFIMLFDYALHNEDTGEVVFKPKIVSELVRCKDCKWYINDRLTKDYTEDKRCKPRVCSIGEFAKYRKPDWFCADGERRKEK